MRCVTDDVREMREGRAYTSDSAMNAGPNVPAYLPPLVYILLYRAVSRLVMCTWHDRCTRSFREAYRAQ